MGLWTLDCCCLLFLSEQGFVQPRRLLFGTSNGTIMCSEPPLLLPWVRYLSALDLAANFASLASDNGWMDGPVHQQIMSGLVKWPSEYIIVLSNRNFVACKCWVLTLIVEVWKFVAVFRVWNFVTFKVLVFVCIICFHHKLITNMSSFCSLVLGLQKINHDVTSYQLNSTWRW